MAGRLRGMASVWWLCLSGLSPSLPSWEVETMRSARSLFLGLAATLAVLPSLAVAGYLRQYYDTSYSYSPSYNYYYLRYYYLPVSTYTTYDYHYCIYYPSQPQYVYYYTPVNQVYWGRYELCSK